MEDNLKMFGRYAIAVVVAFAVGKGWLTSVTGDLINQVVIQVIGLLVAMLPATYAAAKIDNTPKT